MHCFKTAGIFELERPDEKLSGEVEKEGQVNTYLSPDFEVLGE